MNALGRSDTSLTSRTSSFAAGGEIVAAHYLGDTLALPLAGGEVLLVGPDGGERRAVPHADGAVLVAASDGRRLLTGGDDGRVVATAADGTTGEVGTSGGAWIDAVAPGPDGAVAFAAGKTVKVLQAKGEPKTLTVGSTARGLAFAPKGFRLAIARYGGATLWFPNVQGAPQELAWKGSHLDVTWSPDGRFLVTSMQENTLHGWRIVDGQHMRMSGYPSKVRSLAWSPDGKWLATSGADAAIVWPFAAKDGPMGKAPRECGVRPAKITRVAFHPAALVLAMGYEDGCVLMVRLDDGAELLVRPAAAGGPISALTWGPRGTRLAFGTAEGEAGVTDLSA